MQKSSFFYNYTVVKNRFNRNLISFFRFIYLVICNGTGLCLKILNWGSSEDTVFIRISAQPRITTHPTPLPPTKTPMRDNKRPSRRRSFLQGIVQKPCFLTSLLFVISIYCFVAKYTTTLAENGENLISAHLE